MITYPDLGHLFYPSSQWITATGPMDQKILEDLFGWFSDPIKENLRNYPFYLYKACTYMILINRKNDTVTIEGIGRDENPVIPISME